MSSSVPTNEFSFSSCPFPAVPASDVVFNKQCSSTTPLYSDKIAEYKANVYQLLQYTADIAEAEPSSTAPESEKAIKNPCFKPSQKYTTSPGTILTPVDTRAFHPVTHELEFASADKSTSSKSYPKPLTEKKAAETVRMVSSFEPLTAENNILKLARQAQAKHQQEVLDQIRRICKHMASEAHFTCFIKYPEHYIRKVGDLSQFLECASKILEVKITKPTPSIPRLLIESMCTVEEIEQNEHLIYIISTPKPVTSFGVSGNDIYPISSTKSD